MLSVLCPLATVKCNITHTTENYMPAYQHANQEVKEVLCLLLFLLQEKKLSGCTQSTQASSKFNKNT